MLLAQVIEAAGVSYGMMFVKTMIAVIVIIALAFISIKYVLPVFIKMRRKSDSQIQILDFQALEQRKSVYLLKIRNKMIALAASDHALEKLAEWEDGDELTNSRAHERTR